MATSAKPAASGGAPVQSLGMTLEELKIQIALGSVRLVELRKIAKDRRNDRTVRLYALDRLEKRVSKNCGLKMMVDEIRNDIH